MPKYNCIIVDDEPVAQRIIANYLSELPEFEVCGTCLNAIEAMSILDSQSVDLMFLDIEMPKLKGLAFIKTLKNPPHVIITTAHREYALEGFELEALDYLLKPISFERFIKSINRFKKTIKPIQALASPKTATDTDTIYVKSERKTLKINQSEITYIESMNNYIIIHVNEKRHIVYSSMADILDRLNNKFFRIHKSYIVNKTAVTSFSKEQVSIAEANLPIGKAYKDVINDL